MEAYEKRMSALRSGEFVPPPEDSYDPMADIKAHQSKHKNKEVEHESYLNKDQLLELRRVQHERIEVDRSFCKSERFALRGLVLFFRLAR